MSPISDTGRGFLPDQSKGKLSLRCFNTSIWLQLSIDPRSHFLIEDCSFFTSLPPVSYAYVLLLNTFLSFDMMPFDNPDGEVERTAFNQSPHSMILHY